MRKILLAFNVFLLTLVGLPAQAIVFFDNSVAAERIKPDFPAVGFTIVDDRVLTQVSSITGARRGTNITNLVCSSAADPTCTDTEMLRVSAVLPPCGERASASDICIKSLRTGDANRTLQKADLLYQIDTFTFPADLARKLPAGGALSVWKGPSIKGFDLEYTVAVDMQINYYGNTSSVVGFSAQVIPTTTKAGNYFPKKWDNSRSTTNPEGFALEIYDNPSNQPSADDSNNCIWTDLGRCATMNTFFPDQPIELTLQMDNGLSGWLFGRMKDTVASVRPISANTSVLTISGTSINVPAGVAWIPRGEFESSVALQEIDFEGLVRRDPNIQYIGGKPSNHPDLFEFPTFGLPNGGVHTANPTLKGKGMLFAVEKWLQTSGVLPTWRVQGMNPSSFWGMDQSAANKVWECTINDKSKLHGVMTTNSMAYSWSPPSFKDGILSYKVGGAHLDVDGSVYRGSYDLAMNAQSARCIYGFTDAPIKASVSVVGSGGEEQQISTETISVKDGWMTLSAKNFTFSSPTIRIKLSQEQSTKIATKDGASATKAKTKVRTTLTCVKGKSTKKITGLSPKCPSGYKKK